MDNTWMYTTHYTVCYNSMMLQATVVIGIGIKTIIIIIRNLMPVLTMTAAQLVAAMKHEVFQAHLPLPEVKLSRDQFNQLRS